MYLKALFHAYHKELFIIHNLSTNKLIYYPFTLLIKLSVDKFYVLTE